MNAILKITNPYQYYKNYVSFIFLFLILFILDHQISHQRNYLGLTKSSFYDTPKKLLGTAFREIRVTIADILWIKVDTYFHAGLTKEEHELIHPGHPEHLEGLEQQHQNQENAEFLPLIRLVTELDPNFIDAYRSGAWWLWKRLNETQPAIDFLKEGIENNPDRFELHYDLAWLYFFKLENYSMAKQELIKTSQMNMDGRDKASVLELLAFSHERLNEIPQAVLLWKIIRKMNILPYSQTAQRRLSELNRTPDNTRNLTHDLKSS